MHVENQKLVCRAEINNIENNRRHQETGDVEMRVGLP